MPEKTVPSPKGALSPFAEKLAARLSREGPITVADYIAAAAAEYYAGETVFGRSGDFTTAPEISQLFGEMIAIWLTDLWMQMGRPEHVQLIELGPGRGTLTADIMRTLKAWPDFKTAVSLHLVENSPTLRQQQARALASFAPTWYDRLEDVPQGLCFIVANEFLDALPIHQLEKIGGQWLERRVEYVADQHIFAFTHAAPPVDIAATMPADFVNAPEGSIFEVSPASLTVIDTICQRLKTCGGASLIIDYGHSEIGLGDTLQALEKHRYADVLGNPGGRDITAHVDFATCKLAALRHAQVHGPVNQGAFLQRLGIVERAQALCDDAEPSDAKDIQAGLLRLTSPGQMGRLFKVMAITPPQSRITPVGFSDDTGGHEEMDDTDG